MKKEFYLELWLSVLAFSAMVILLVLGWGTFVLVGGYILQMKEPLFFKLVFGGFVMLLLIPMSYGIWGSSKLLKARAHYKRVYIPRDSDQTEPAKLSARASFYGQWPHKIGEYHECRLSFPSGKADVVLKPKFVSTRALDAIATSSIKGAVNRDGEVVWRDGFPYLFRDESFRLWFIPNELDDKPTKVS